MKVGMYYSNSDVRIEEQEIPKIDDDSLLLKVMASGICGSDLMEYHRMKKAPFVPGHELAGGIVEVGKNIERYVVGDRVFATHHVPCMTCRECLGTHYTQCEEFKTINNFNPGGFAEYLKISGRSLKTGVIKLPDSMSYEQASFIEPLGTAIEVSRELDGESVLILGAGVAGLLNIQTSRAFYAKRIITTDISDYRLEAAKKFGADYVFNAKDYTPEALREVNEGRLADRVIICTGAKAATEQAFKSYDQGGEIIFFATPPENVQVEVDWNNHWRTGLTTKMTYGATPESNEKAFNLIKYERIFRVSEMVTHRFPLDKIGNAFKLAAEGDKCLKVMINPHS